MGAEVSQQQIRPWWQRCFRFALGFLAWLYPLLVFLQHKWPHPVLQAFTFLLLATLMLRFILGLDAKKRVWALGALAVLGSAMAWFEPQHLVRLYPFMISSGALFIFVQARRPEDNPMIIPLRRQVQEKPFLLATLHRAKNIWLVGLSLNSLIFLAFLFAFSTESWALYASVYSYLLLLFLFVLTLIYVSIEKHRSAA